MAEKWVTNLSMEWDEEKNEQKHAEETQESTEKRSFNNDIR